MTRALRRRMDQLRQRRGGRSWIEPAGVNEEGIDLEAHIFEHANGEHWALVVPAPVDCETWQRLAQAQQARRLSSARLRRNDEAAPATDGAHHS